MACLDTIAISEFKALFFRDFPYLPTWVVTTTYNTGDQVYYETNGLFYQCLNNGVVGGDPSTDATNWVLYSDNTFNYVLDADITKAFNESLLSFNSNLPYGTCEQVKHVFYYLSAHYLVQDIKTSQQGLQSSGDFITSSRTVGSVSETYEIPDIYKNNPIYSFYTKSSYGIKFLNLTIPYIVGNINAVEGDTTP